MRLKWGRPSLADQPVAFDVPEAGGDVGVTFVGVSTLLFRDSDTAVLFDGFFSRPSLLRVAVARLRPDETAIASAMARLGLALGGGRGRRLDAIVPVHTHYDHVLDSAVVAQGTGARLIGGESAANVGRGAGLPGESIRIASTGDSIGVGDFTLTLVASAHCPPDRYPGEITAPLVTPARVTAYRCGEAWSVLVDHASGRKALVQGSAGYVRGGLAGRSADVAYLGIGQLGINPEDYIREYWQETVRTVGARRVVLTHWDDFFQPLSRPLRALPYAGDDLDKTLQIFSRLAQEDAVTVHLPRIWRHEDPWRGLARTGTADA